MCATAPQQRWQPRFKFWITIGSIIFKVHRFDRTQTHALMCVRVCDSFFFFVLYLLIRATLACYIFGAMTDKIYEQKIFFFLKNLYEFFPFMH